VNVIETLGLRLGDRQPLDGDNPETRLFDLGENGGGMALANRIGLDDTECAL
jgi:hypothetical protein